MRWQAPPGWPDPPPGFVPSFEWRPSPNWPPPPAGWVWWRTESVLAEQFSGGVLWFGVVWLAAVICGTSWFAGALDRAGDIDRLSRVVGLVGGGAVAGITAIWGAVLGATARWLVLLASALTATAILLTGYVALMFASAAPDDTTTENAAGVGLVIFALPTALVVGTNLLLGASPAAAVRYVRRRSSTRQQ